MSASAEVTETEVQPEPRRLDPAQTEWAIAPEVAETGEGMVLSEDLVLAAEMVLPGGTVLPAGTRLPAGTILPAGTRLPPPAALEQGPTPAALPASGAPPASQSVTGVPYLSGGIGVSGREEMELVKSNYNLRMLFAEQGSGIYLSGIQVRIEDAAGPTLLTAVSRGPWFFAQLEPGAYRVTVEYAGQLQARDVNVPTTGATQQDFYWAP